MARTARRPLEAAEMQIGQDKPRDQKSTGPAKKSLEPAHVEPVEGPVSSKKLENLKFAEDVLTVMVHETTNPEDHPSPEVWNDGRMVIFPRGVEIQVKRKFVEVLARSKKRTFSQQKIVDVNGIESYRNIPHTALTYPFTIVHDPSPNGRAWLKKILAEA
jgi:hypothetical protein